jgi:hypothetical protein
MHTTRKFCNRIGQSFKTKTYTVNYIAFCTDYVNVNSTSGSIRWYNVIVANSYLFYLNSRRLYAIFFTHLPVDSYGDWVFNTDIKDIHFKRAYGNPLRCCRAV